VAGEKTLRWGVRVLQPFAAQPQPRRTPGTEFVDSRAKPPASTDRLVFAFGPVREFRPQTNPTQSRKYTRRILVLEQNARVPASLAGYGAGQRVASRWVLVVSPVRSSMRIGKPHVIYKAWRKIAFDVCGQPLEGRDIERGAAPLMRAVCQLNQRWKKPR